MSDPQVPSERHFRFHRRQMLIYLLGCTAMAVGTVVAVLTPGENPELVWAPPFAAFGLMMLSSLIMRGLRQTEYKREMRRILEDEWILRGSARARRVALQTVIFAQVPLVFFMAYAPPEPSMESSVIGMGAMTVALGSGMYAAGYLYYTRVTSDE